MKSVWLTRKLTVAKRVKDTGYRFANQSRRELCVASTRNRYERYSKSGVGSRWCGHKVRLADTANASTSSILIPGHCQPSDIHHHPPYFALRLQGSNRASLQLAQRPLWHCLFDPLHGADTQLVHKGPSPETPSLYCILHKYIHPTSNKSYWVQARKGNPGAEQRFAVRR